MLKGPDKSKILEKLIEDNPQATEKLNAIVNKNIDEIKEFFGVNFFMLCATLSYGMMAWLCIDSMPSIQAAGIGTMLMWTLMTSAGFGARLLQVGFSGLQQDASIFYRNLKILGRIFRNKELLLDVENNLNELILNHTTLDDYYNLMKMFHNFKLTANPDEQISNDDFLGYLIREKQFDKILTLVKLFSNKIEDLEEYEALSANTPGRHSLQWQCAKVVNKAIDEGKICNPQEVLHEDVKLILDASNKFAV